MKPVFVAPKHLLEKKPPHGAPCTRCGLCCMATLCKIGEAVFRRSTGPCPALLWNKDGSVCGLVAVSEGEMKDAAKLLILSGDGCDARFNGEPVNPAFHAKLSRLDEAYAPHIKRAKILWGIK